MRVYLLIKLFTSTGLPVHELEQVTVEAAGDRLTVSFSIISIYGEIKMEVEQDVG